MPNLDYDITQPYLGLINRYRPKPDEVDMDTQRKIAKGNATAEAFRLLIDAIGGAKGANIQERKEPANAVMGAVDRYYKAKDANKAEQSDWDKLELGAGLDALKTKSQQDFATQKQKESQEFSAEQAGLTRKQQAEQFEAGKLSDKEKLAQQSEQFKSTLGLNEQELGLKREMAKTNAEIDREKIAADREKVQAMYPYGRLSGLAIADEETDQIIRIPNDKIEQTLAFMEKDPLVQDQIGFIKAKYNNLGSTQEVKYLIAQNYSSLSPETKKKIRALSQGEMATKATESPTPTIKTDKNSTVVRVENAPQPQQAQATPEQVAYLQKIIEAKNYAPEVKRSAIYKYLVNQGYDPQNAKSVADQAYQSLTGN